jgi:hypothetical protein
MHNVMTCKKRMTICIVVMHLLLFPAALPEVMEVVA